MKRNYIEPELLVIACKPRAILMESVLNPEVTTPQTITPTDDVFEGEFSGREFKFDDLDDYEDEDF